MNYDKIYKFTLLLRFIFVFFHGYVHPDEFFQSIEVSSRVVLRIDTFIPWEYQPEHACRSIVIPMLSTGIPLLILQKLNYACSFFFHTDIWGRMLLYGPRMWMMLLSLIMDRCLYSILLNLNFSFDNSNDRKIKIYRTLSFFGSSWGILVFGTRYFSNTVEAILLALSLQVAFTSNNYISKQRAIVLGAIFALGTFTRFTFLFFTVPIGLYVLYKNYRPVAFSPLPERIYKSISLVASLGIGFLLVSFACIFMDSLYFGKFAIAPLNNFIYNLDPKNLAEHGIHPRVTHLVVNFPLLLGPMAMVAYSLVIKIIKLLANSSFAKKTKQQGEVNAEVLTMVGCIAIYMFFLSMAPHQELRFLVPLIFPTFLLVSSSSYSTVFSARTFVALWILVNAICATMFGVLHQGGVTKALCALQQQIAADNTPYHVDIIFYKTYMPPRFLLAIPETNKLNISLHDLMGKGLDEFTQNLVSGQNYREHKTVMYIVCPQTIGELQELYPERKEFYEHFQPMGTFWPHFSGEQFRSDLALQLYKYSSENV